VGRGAAQQGGGTVQIKEGTMPEEALSASTSQGRERPRGRVRVFRNWCKGCGLCIAFCPRQVFKAGEEHRPVVAQPERCTACQWCAMHCPDFAITVEVITNGSEAAK
jgi:2-oxoglutarate ferredoxin oxidoreductase subunit delta